MGRLLQWVNRVSMLLGFVMIVNGCAPSLMVGGMSAAPSGATYVSSFGEKIESYQIVSYPDTLAAVRRAATILSVEVKKESVAAKKASFQFADSEDRVVDVVIEQRTATMTCLKVNTGWFGPHGMGRLLLRQILKEISESGDTLQDRADKPLL